MILKPPMSPVAWTLNLCIIEFLTGHLGPLTAGWGTPGKALTGAVFKNMRGFGVENHEA